MLQCSIKKWVRTSRGLAMPGPKLVPLPDDEARRLAARGDVEIVEGAPAPAKPPLDRRGKKPPMTRAAEGA